MGRFDDIEIYIDQLKKLDYFPDYVMVEQHENKHWGKFVKLIFKNFK